MISHRDIARAVYIVDQSGIVDIVVGGYRTSRRGRRPNVAGLRLMFIGLFLTIAHEGKATLTGAHRMLTKKLPLDAQVELGVVEIVDGKPEHRVSLDGFYKLEQAVCQRLAYTETSEPELEPDERSRRHHTVQEYCDALMDVFQILDKTTSTVAIDATGVWSWGRGYSMKKADRLATTEADDLDVPNDAHATDTGDAAELADLEPTDEADDNDLECVRVRPVRRRDLDAAWGIKTSKNGGDERYFGFAEHTLVQVPDEDDDNNDSTPKLITRFELTVANADVVDVTLGLIDRNPATITDLIADRHYHYKQVDRWKRQLVARGIEQHLDLRADEHGFTESDSLRWAAGVAHCPATPDRFRTIPRPGADADKDTQRAFHAEIERRSAYALAIHDRPDANGTHRCVCPAVAGKVGCPLRPETLQASLQLGLPIVDSPPSTDTGEPLPKCCTQQTVRVTPPDSQFKLMQRRTWGSERWLRIWNRRSYVEGSYGNRKNTSTENLRRGQFQVFGLVWAHIVMGLVNASYNLRMLENWCDRHPDHGLDHHPLIANEPVPTCGYLAVTAEEFALLMRARQANSGAAA